jgi:hypothetical protein
VTEDPAAARPLTGVCLVPMLFSLIASCQVGLSLVGLSGLVTLAKGPGDLSHERR